MYSFRYQNEMCLVTNRECRLPHASRIVPSYKVIEGPIRGALIRHPSLLNGCGWFGDPAKRNADMKKHWIKERLLNMHISKKSLPINVNYWGIIEIVQVMSHTRVLMYDILPFNNLTYKYEEDTYITNLTFVLYSLLLRKIK